MKTAERFEKVINYFSEAMPVAETELEYMDPYELIVAVILSAQCTDKRVNMITPSFFRSFPNATSLAAAKQEEVAVKPAYWRLFTCLEWHACLIGISMEWSPIRGNSCKNYQV